MHIKEQSLDDILRRVFAKLLNRDFSINPSRGRASEYIGVLIQLTNPLARLSRTENRGHFFSAFGEFLWYLSGRNDLAFIGYYAPAYGKDAEDDGTLYGAYGPRLLNMHGKYNQLDQVIELLKKNPDTRRAVIQLFDAADIAADKREIPCTCTLQFLVRSGKVHLVANMRSNDAYKGLPHDVFAFTMLQELVARQLQLHLGEYRHFVGSLHLYECTAGNASDYLEEGWQESIAMPAMPPIEHLSVLEKVLDVESKIRNGNDATDLERGLPQYWQDMVNLLRIYKASRDGDESTVARCAGNMQSSVFEPYIFQKAENAARRRDDDGPFQGSFL